MKRRKARGPFKPLVLRRDVQRTLSLDLFNQLEWWLRINLLRKPNQFHRLVRNAERRTSLQHSQTSSTD